MSLSSKQIHSRLSHPIIDSDGHWREFDPIALDYLRETAGQELVDKWNNRVRVLGEDGTSSKEKLDRRTGQAPWWALATPNTLDTATSFIPRLLYDRLDDMGIDFAILYPSSLQLFAPYLGDQELRLAGCHAFNRYAAETWNDFSDRVTPIGVIPMHTPEEAITELEHCKELGIKAVALGSLMRRSVPDAERRGISRRYACWLDVLGIDSDHDYDPVWQKCQDLGYPATFHSAAENYGLRNSPSNFVFNHIGHFAAAGHAVCKALFLGGVTRRFPKMRFAFLEGGVSWGCTLLADLISHWEKRNIKAVQLLSPANLDRVKLHELVKKFGTESMNQGWPEFLEVLDRGMGNNVPEELDDFVACRINNKEELKDLFVPNFFFGCEADDANLTHAFNRQVNPFGAQLSAVLSSDISHFDVSDMTEVLAEAWELVEDHGLSEEDFYSFAFGNAARLWSDLNPEFFKGTVIESAIQSLEKPD